MTTETTSKLGSRLPNPPTSSLVEYVCARIGIHVSTRCLAQISQDKITNAVLSRKRITDNILDHSQSPMIGSRASCIQSGEPKVTKICKKKVNAIRCDEGIAGKANP